MHFLERSQTSKKAATADAREVSNLQISLFQASYIPQTMFFFFNTMISYQNGPSHITISFLQTQQQVWEGVSYEPSWLLRLTWWRGKGITLYQTLHCSEQFLTSSNKLFEQV